MIREAATLFKGGICHDARSQRWCNHLTVSTKTRTAIWNEMLSIERTVRYYESLSGIYRRKYECWRALIVITGAVTGVASQWSNAIPLISSGVLGALVAWDFIVDSATKAAQLLTSAPNAVRSRLNTRNSGTGSVTLMTTPTKPWSAQNMNGCWIAAFL